MIRVRVMDPFGYIPYSSMLHMMDDLFEELEKSMDEVPTRLRHYAKTNPVELPPKNEPKTKNEPKQTVHREEIKKEEEPTTEKTKVERAEDLFEILPDDTDLNIDKFEEQKEEKPLPDYAYVTKKKVFKATPKPTTVECVLWDGTDDTRGDIFVWSGFFAQIINNQLYLIPSKSMTNQSILIANVGDYIIKDESGNFSVVTEETLKSKYNL